MTEAQQQQLCALAGLWAISLEARRNELVAYVTRLIGEARADEREQIAKIADALSDDRTARRIAALIRARAKEEE